MATSSSILSTIQTGADNGLYLAIGLVGANLLAGTQVAPIAAGILALALLSQYSLLRQGK
jgi:hypothetical protein